MSLLIIRLYFGFALVFEGNRKSAFLHLFLNPNAHIIDMDLEMRHIIHCLVFKSLPKMAESEQVVVEDRQKYPLIVIYCGGMFAFGHNRNKSI